MPDNAPRESHAQICGTCGKEIDILGCECVTEWQPTPPSVPTAEDRGMAETLVSGIKVSSMPLSAQIPDIAKLFAAHREAAHKAGLAEAAANFRSAINSLDWLTQRIEEGRGAWEFCLTEDGNVGLFLANEPSVRGRGDNALEAIEDAIYLEKLRATPAAPEKTR